MASLKEIKGNQVAAKTPQATLQTFLEKGRAQLAAALPKHITPERMTRLAITAFNQSKQLQNCSIDTIANSMILASQLGLEPGVNGQGSLVPYGKSCTFVPGWKGLVDLFNRAGKGTVWTGAVFDGDEFDWGLGDRPFVSHKPSGEDDPALLTHVYAVGRLNGSEWPVIDVWPVAKCIRHRDRNNKVGKSHYSFSNMEMYCRKLPLLQVLKYLPSSIELTRALDAEHAAEQGRTFDLKSDDFIQVNEPEVESQQDTQVETAAEEAPKESLKKKEAEAGEWE